MKKLTIKVKTRRSEGFKNCFRGFVEVFEGTRKLWTEQTGIVRLHKFDALNDAKNLALEIQDHHTTQAKWRSTWKK